MMAMHARGMPFTPKVMTITVKLMACAPIAVTFTRKPIAFTCKRTASGLSEVGAYEDLLPTNASDNAWNGFFATVVGLLRFLMRVGEVKKRPKRFRVLLRRVQKRIFC